MCYSLSSNITHMLNLHCLSCIDVILRNKFNQSIKERDSNPETFECRPSALLTQPSTSTEEQSQNKPSH